MIRETLKVKVTDEYKEQADKLIDDTINTVLMKTNHDLSSNEKKIIKNLCLDQVNINVSTRAKTKTYWTFDSESHIPIIVEKEEEKHKTKNINKKITKGYYRMKPNLTWTFVKNNSDKKGLIKQEFEEKVLEMLLEDFETAAFYGALSYITESEAYGR